MGRVFASQFRLSHSSLIARKGEFNTIPVLRSLDSTANLSVFFNESPHSSNSFRFLTRIRWRDLGNLFRRPDAIATFQVGGDSINFLRQAMQLGVKIPYTGRIELGGRNTPIIEAGGMEKSISAWTYNATIDSPSNKAFVEKIKAKYKSEPYLQTWGGYDAIRIIAQAITDCKCTDGEKIKDAIKKMTFVNVMGKTVTFDDHNSAGRFVVLQTVLDKKVGVADIVEVK